MFVANDVDQFGLCTIVRFIAFETINHRTNSVIALVGTQSRVALC